MKQQPVVEQLAGVGFVQVGGILEWAALKVAPGGLPAAYVLPGDESAGDNRNDGGIDQRVATEFGIALVLNAAARSQGSVSEQLDVLTKAVKAKLAGWTHPEAAGPTLYAGGRMLSVDGGSLAWLMRFRTAYHLRVR